MFPPPPGAGRGTVPSVLRAVVALVLVCAAGCGVGGPDRTVELGPAGPATVSEASPGVVWAGGSPDGPLSGDQAVGPYGNQSVVARGGADRAGSLPRLSGPAAGRWWRVLHRLDRAREAAYDRQRPGLLSRVYAPGSALLRRDRAVLGAYRERGVRLGPVRLDVSTLRVTRHSGGSVRLRVVERLAPTTAVLPGGARVALPADAPTRRSLRLVHTPAGWRLAAAHRLAG